MKKTLFTITCTMFSLGLLVSVSPAQSTRVNTKPKIKKPVVKKKVNTKKANPKLAAKLAPTSPAQCAKQLANSTNLRFKALCVRGAKTGKQVHCHGSRAVPNTEIYRTQYCTVQQATGDRNYQMSRSGRSTRAVSPLLTADFACGCGPHRSTPCSGGLCGVDLPD